MDKENLKRNTVTPDQMRPVTLYTFVEKDVLLEMDCDRAVPVSLTYMGKKREDERPLWRLLTPKEKRELRFCTLAYGRSPLWYRLFRVLKLSMTKCLYPQQGLPKTPADKICN